VIPAEIARLRPPGTPDTAQMLYRFDGAATAAAIDADAAAVSEALPAGAVTGTRSYLTVKAADTARIAAYVPVLIACGLAGWSWRC
jgi:putative ABC transport system permease protein